MAEEPVSPENSPQPRKRRRLPGLFRLKRGEGKTRPRVFAVLPTLMTLANAMCGFGAITFATKVGLDPKVGWGKSDSDCLFIAGMLIFLAMVFDALDGRVARWAKQSSEFGAQLDSLCDAISFGVAPAIILVKYVDQVLHPRVLWVIAIMYMCCAILRLARFNVETDEDDSHDAFSGLPSPAAAGTIASLMIAVPEIKQLASANSDTASWWQNQIRNVMVPIHDSLPYILPLVTFASACLMVSRFRYPHIFNQWVRGRRSSRHILQLLLVLSAAFMVRELALPLIFWFFAYGAPIRSMFLHLFKRGTHPGAPPSSQGSEKQQTA